MAGATLLYKVPVFNIKNTIEVLFNQFSYITRWEYSFFENRPQAIHEIPYERTRNSFIVVANNQLRKCKLRYVIITIITKIRT